MSLARVKVWNPGDVLTASDLNSEFNNILNNPVSLISPSTGAINFNLQAHTGLLPSVITGTSGSAGQVLTVSTAAASTPIWQNPGSGGVSRVRGLIGLISSQTATLAADQYTMQSSDGLKSWTVTATSSFGVSIGTAGPAAGGRDVAGAFSSTDVHWYAITTGPGSTAPAGIVSSQAPPTGPVLPTGYSGWTYLGGSAYTSASTTVQVEHRFRGSLAMFSSRPVAVSGGTSTTLATISNVALIPRNALSYAIDGNVTVGYNSAADATGTIDIHATTSGAVGSGTHIAVGALLGVSAGHSFQWMVGPFRVAQSTAQNFAYNHNHGSTASISSVSVGLLYVDYSMPNGDA